MSDSNPAATFGYVAEQLDQFPLAYLHVIEPRVRGNETMQRRLRHAPCAASIVAP